MAELTEYERGKEEGRINAIIDGHTARLSEINGNIKRFAQAIETLGSDTRKELAKVSTEIRDMNEAGRARDLAVQVTAETLAKETERRRIEEDRLRIERAQALEVPVRTWNLWANKAQVLAVCITLVFALSALYVALHSLVK